MAPLPEFAARRSIILPSPRVLGQGKAFYATITGSGGAAHLSFSGGREASLKMSATAGSTGLSRALMQASSPL